MGTVEQPEGVCLFLLFFNVLYFDQMMPPFRKTRGRTKHLKQKLNLQNIPIKPSLLFLKENKESKERINARKLKGK
jgi:hypothetical protein